MIYYDVMFIELVILIYVMWFAMCWISHTEVLYSGGTTNRSEKQLILLLTFRGEVKKPPQSTHHGFSDDGRNSYRILSDQTWADRTCDQGHCNGCLTLVLMIAVLLTFRWHHCSAAAGCLLRRETQMKKKVTTIPRWSRGKLHEYEVTKH